MDLNDHRENEGGWADRPLPWRVQPGFGGSGGGRFFHGLAWIMAGVTALLYLAALFEDWLHSIF
ncbi:MAG: hypothetical protein WCC66_02880 [Rhizobiaceae bacterium]